MFTSRRFIDNIEVQVGSVWPYRPLMGGFSIGAVAKCISVNPDRFVATASLNGHEILTSEPWNDPHRAISAAHEAVVSRFIKVLRDADSG